MITNCKHEQFTSSIRMTRLEDTGGFMADIMINCSQCGIPFQFKGLSKGVDITAPMVSPDETEARLPLAPYGKEVQVPLGAPVGFKKISAR